MNDSALTRFFGVVVRPRTWLGIVFHLLAFPLGLFYFVFLVTGLAVGVGLVIIWVGIPILLVVAGAWWLFAAFERVQARYLLGAEIPPAPRPWERADGIWGKLKAHFGSGSTWRDLAYLITKLAFGLMSFSLLVAFVSAVGSLFAMPFFAVYDVPVVNGTWVPPLWVGILCVVLGALVFVIGLHAMNAWGWVCARWAEVLFRGPAQSAPPAAAVAPAPSTPPSTPPSGPLPPPELLARPAPPAPTEEPADRPAVGAEPATEAPAQTQASAGVPPAQTESAAGIPAAADAETAVPAADDETAS